MLPLRCSHAGLALAFAAALGSCAAAAEKPSTPPEAGLHFPVPLSGDLPYDVNLDALRRLSETPQKQLPPFDIADANLPYSQRLFDIFAWQAFLALNWPAQTDGAPDKSKNLADTVTPRVWEYYVDVGLVYRENGAPPLPWSEAVKTGLAGRTLWMSGMGVGKPSEAPGSNNGGIQPPVLDESLQAFTGPMVDQAGNWVRYQAAMNSVAYDYLVANKLYNLEGQAAFTAKHKIEFPANVGTTKYGAMEIKLSWKQLNERDDPKRFLTRKAKVVRLDGSTFEAEFGVVGMHITVRTQSSPTWIWATFEQVDNTTVNDLERDSQGRTLRPNFFNPDNPTKPVNVLPAKNSAPVKQYDPKTGKDTGAEVFTSWDESKTTDPTQTLMVLPIPKATAALNREVRALLEQLGSVFQYYELIGTQWPQEPSFPAFPNGVAAQADGRLLPAAPESLIYKIPGKVVPVFLVNTTMETFFQAGAQPAGPQAEDDRLPPGLYADPSTVFATESCAGCHFSAGACIAFKKDANGRFLVQERDGKFYRVPIYGKNASRGVTGNADFSWLMQLRAQSAPYARKTTDPKTGREIFVSEADGKPVTVALIEAALVPQTQKACPAN